MMCEACRLGTYCRYPKSACQCRCHKQPEAAQPAPSVEVTHPHVPRHDGHVFYGCDCGWKVPETDKELNYRDMYLYSWEQFKKHLSSARTAREFLRKSEQFAAYDTNGAYLMKGYELEELLETFASKLLERSSHEANAIGEGSGPKENKVSGSGKPEVRRNPCDKRGR